MAMENLDNHRIVIISDLHLDQKFNPKKFSLIERAVKSGDKLIINGDLWEGFDIDFSDFLQSDWQQLFWLFRSHEAVYLFGNHDPDQRNLSAYAEMAVQTGTRYEFSQNDVNFLVTHGDLFDPTLDLRHPNLPRWLLSLGSKIERLLIRVFGLNYLKVYLESNAKMRRWQQQNLDANTWLICGHSHLPALDTQAKYANSGIFLQPGLAATFWWRTASLN